MNLMQRVLIAIVPGLVFTIGEVGIQLFAGKPNTLGEIGYQWLLPAFAIARFAGMFGLAGLVWSLLRNQAVSKPLLLLAWLSGPIAYSISAIISANRWFSSGEAFYYAINPLFVAALGASAAAMCVAELVKRRKWITRFVFGAAAGWALLWVTVIWDGGVHWFYLYQQGYRALFG